MFLKQRTAYALGLSLVGSDMGIRDSGSTSSGSASTTGSPGSEAPNAAAVMNDNGIAAPLEVDEMDADGDDALRSVPEIADDDARLGL